MKSKQQAVHEFMGSFGLTAYPVSAVPDKAAAPYLTYTQVDAGWDEQEQNIAVDVWLKTTSEKRANDAVDKIAAKVSLAGITVPCDTGLVWIKRGSPFAQNIPTEDNSLKHRHVNLTVEYMTTY